MIPPMSVALVLTTTTTTTTTSTSTSKMTMTMTMLTKNTPMPNRAPSPVSSTPMTSAQSRASVSKSPRRSARTFSAASLHRACTNSSRKRTTSPSEMSGYIRACVRGC
ncbi:DNA polymerase iota [Histoplasma capsulatum G186AR]|nr:DNA polymerase iota [Histoplasma capsulatum G186AR]